MHRRQIERTYDRLAKYYDRFFNKVFHKGRVKAIEYLDIQNGDTILEIGVGTGLSMDLYPEGCTVHGIDLSADMLSFARQRLKTRPLAPSSVFLHRMDGASLAVKNDQFDSIIAAYVMSATPDPLGMLREMMRVCKAGGKIVFINHFENSNTLVAGIEKLISPFCIHMGFKTDLKLMPLLLESDLVVSKQEGVNMLNHWRVVQCINP